MDERNIKAYTENVVLLQEKDTIIGFIRNAEIFLCEAAKTDDVALLIDPNFGVISRAVKRNGEG